MTFAEICAEAGGTFGLSDFIQKIFPAFIFTGRAARL